MKAKGERTPVIQGAQGRAGLCISFPVLKQGAGKAAEVEIIININHINEKHTHQAVHYSDIKYFARELLVRLPHIIHVNVSRSHGRSKLPPTTSSAPPDEPGGRRALREGTLLPCVLKPNGGK